MPANLVSDEEAGIAQGPGPLWGWDDVLSLETETAQRFALFPLLFGIQVLYKRDG